MSSQMNVSAGDKELAIFQVQEMLCGITTLHVQEINQNTDITPVHRAPDFVRGVINLRGEIVTVIDLHKKFGLEPVEIHEDMQVLVVRYNDEFIGLLVDCMQDVVIAKESSISPPPSNVDGISGAYFEGIFRMEKDLVVILNLRELLKK